MKITDNMRGMSEPFPFSFSVQKKDKTLIVHAVIFTTYEMLDGDAEIGLLTEESDCRMHDLVRYIWSNFLKEKKKEFQKQMDLLEANVEKSNKTLEFLKSKVKEENQ